MGVRPILQKTEIGVYPNDWTIVKLGDIGQAFIGLTYSPKNISIDGHLVLRSSNIENGKLVFDDNVYVRMDVPEKAITREDDILICVRNGSRDLIGKCAKIDLHADGMAFGAFMTVFRTGYHKYVFHQFQSDIVGKQIKAHLGATINQITNKSLNSFQIPLPSTLTEQEAIAEALSDADAYIEVLEQLIAKKRQIKQGVMQELLTGRRRLPGFTGEWKERKIADIATLATEKNNAEEDLPVLSCSKHLGFVDSLSYFKNQVFSNDTRPYKLIRRGQIGYPANHVEEGSIGLQDLYDIALVSPIYVVFTVNDGVDSYFLYRVLKLDSYRQKFKVATTSSVDRRGSLRWPAFSELAVLIPSFPEQVAIVSILRDMDTEIIKLDEKLAKMRQIQQGMKQELLTGRIRLV